MKITKLILGFTFLLFSLGISGCKSTDQEKVAVNETEIESENETSSEENQVTPSWADNHRLFGDRQSYTGWIDPSPKLLTAGKGNIRIVAKPRKGTFNIQVLQENGKAVSVLSPLNEYSTSAFYLKMNNSIYKLCADGNIQTNTYKTDNGLNITYSIPKVADVTVEFECIKSPGSPNEDILKVSVTAENTYGKQAEYALKTVLDTVLGETTKVHFYANGKTAVNKETVYRSMKNQKWIVSKNDTTSMQVLLFGTDISPVESVYLGSFTSLDTKNWEPSVNSNTAFDTVLSYNNSGIEINWPGERLEGEKSIKSVFYIAFGVDGEDPNGEKFLRGRQPKNEVPATVPDYVPFGDFEEAEVQNEGLDVEKLEDPEPLPTPIETSEEKPVSKKVQPSAPVTAKKAESLNQYEANNKILPEPSVSKDGNSRIYPSAAVTNKNNLRYDINSLSKEQLTPGYVQTLLDRINALEEGGIANQDEILQLNAELDAILSVLRQ